jgi:hypothetical protein
VPGLASEANVRLQLRPARAPPMLSVRTGARRAWPSGSAPHPPTPWLKEVATPSAGSSLSSPDPAHTGADYVPPVSSKIRKASSRAFGVFLMYMSVLAAGSMAYLRKLKLDANGSGGASVGASGGGGASGSSGAGGGRHLPLTGAVELLGKRREAS